MLLKTINLLSLGVITRQICIILFYLERYNRKQQIGLKLKSLLNKTLGLADCHTVVHSNSQLTIQDNRQTKNPVN